MFKNNRGRASLVISALALALVVTLVLRNNAQAQSVSPLSSATLNKTVIESRLRGQILFADSLVRSAPNHPLNDGVYASKNPDFSAIFAYTEGYGTVSIVPLSEKETVSAVSYAYRYVDAAADSTATELLRKYFRETTNVAETPITRQITGVVASARLTNARTFRLASKDGQSVNYWTIMVKGSTVTMLGVEGATETDTRIQASSDDLKTQLISQQAE